MRVAGRTGYIAILLGLHQDLDGPLQRDPPSGAIHLCRFFVADAYRFVGSNDACFHKFEHVGKSLLEPRGQPPDAKDVGEEAIADHGPPYHSSHHPLLPGRSDDKSLEVDGDGVWPRKLAILLPPSFHHKGDVETEKEGDGKTRRLVPAPSDQLLQLDLLVPGE